MAEVSEAEVTIDNFTDEEWMEYSIQQRWSDGLPLLIPTVDAVERMLSFAPATNESFAAIPPRWVIPTIQSIAANAVMAGCRPEYFPSVLGALRAVSQPDYNLHGILATTHPCGPMLLFNGPSARKIGMRSGSNCLGQGWRANAAIGRALQLILRNIGGARPGETDRASHGGPAKYSFCFAEDEDASPWDPYHVRMGYSVEDDVVTSIAGEGPHNVNDHGSTKGDNVLTTVAGTMSQVGSNQMYCRGPCFIILGPEHAMTIHRDGYSIEDIQAILHNRSKVHFSRVADENLNPDVGNLAVPVVNDYCFLIPKPEDIHIVVAGGPGKHSVFVPSFSFTRVISETISSKVA
jgi:hypothetical protein